LTSDDCSNPNSTPRPIARRRPQVGLRTTILVVALAALVMSIVADRRRMVDLAPKINALRPMIREFEVDDPTQITVRCVRDYWFHENRWDVYLPEGRNYRLCAAGRAVEDQKQTKPERTMPIASGRQVVDLKEVRDLKHREWIVGVGSGRFTFEEDRERQSPGGSRGGNKFGVLTQVPADQPLFLYSRIYQGADRSKTPTGPTDGFLLWIEPDPSRPK